MSDSDSEDEERVEYFYDIIDRSPDDFLRAGLLKLVHDLNLFVGPQVLNRLIGFLRNGDAELREGLWLAGVVTLSQIVMSVR